MLPLPVRSGFRVAALRGGNPGTLLHPFTGARGGIALDEEIPLERAFPGESPRLAPVEAGTRCGIAAAGQSVWVATNLPQGIVRVDYDRGTAAQSRIVRSVALPRAPLAVAVGFGSVWATDNELNLIRRTDPDTGRTTRSIQVGNDPVAIVAGAGAVRVANRGDGSLSRINPETNSVTKAISVGDTPVAVAVGEGSVWVADSSDDAVDRIDPATNRLAESIAVEHQPQGLAVAGGLIWVTLRGG